MFHYKKFHSVVLEHEPFQRQISRIYTPYVFVARKNERSQHRQVAVGDESDTIRRKDSGRKTVGPVPGLPGSIGVTHECVVEGWGEGERGREGGEGGYSAIRWATRVEEEGVDSEIRTRHLDNCRGKFNN